jgi:hypothetical protein
MIALVSAYINLCARKMRLEGITGQPPKPPTRKPKILRF